MTFQLTLRSHCPPTPTGISIKSMAQAMGIATMKTELNWALEENRKVKEIFDPDQLVSGLLKVINNVSIKEAHKTDQDTQYRGIVVLSGGQGSPSWHVVPVELLSWR